MTKPNDSMTYTVSSLTNEIKQTLSQKFMSVRVRGEVTNVRRQQSGHIYFSLKDNHSQISVALFQGYAKTLTKVPRDGDQIVLEGELSIYAPRGTYQIIGKKIEFDGVGELLIKLHKLKEKLKQQGYFDPKHKKPLPSFPKRIGIITSPTGAVLRDVIHVLSRRLQGFHLILNPVSVQGSGAAMEIADAINQFNAHNLVDVIIVGRGGGSLEDLWPFNEECVAHAIYQSNIPIVSAVGHETDYSISDFVADVRAPTPSAAAEIISKERSALTQTFIQIQNAIDRQMHSIIERHRLILEKVKSHPAICDPYFLTQYHIQTLDHFRGKLDRSIRYIVDTKKLMHDRAHANLHSISPSAVLKQHREKLQFFHKQLRCIDSTLQRKKDRLGQITAHLASVNPKNVLKKGYCIAFSENKHSVMMGTSDVGMGDLLSLQFHDGRVLADVKQLQKDKK